jgi:hypothetical protein
MHRRVLLLLGALALAAPAGADPVGCRGAIAKAAAKHAQKAAKALQRCRDRILTGGLPASFDCHLDAGVAAARAKLEAGVARACCGADGPCGAGDDEALAAIGWTTCPDLESAGCAAPIVDLAGVTDCLACLGVAGADELVEVTYAAFDPGARGSALQACQSALGRETVRFYAAATKALQRCWDARNRGQHANPCPDPGDGRAAAAITRAEATKVARLCAACGGGDGACGGGDDVLPATVGVLDACPAVTLPGGGSCAAPIATLADLVACVDCLAAFATTCRDAAAVPAFTAYPGECDPPRGTCSAGVECATSLDCPAGYTCEDNGGATRYCVGATCTTDAECGGGGVCRQYCTVAGCGARQCQCPGFGCFGPDEVCLDDGGLACRKLCTQDSDCTAPHGYVCVNPGFGFGVCIGSIPCQ